MRIQTTHPRSFRPGTLAHTGRAKTEGCAISPWYSMIRSALPFNSIYRNKTPGREHYEACPLRPSRPREARHHRY